MKLHALMIATALTFAACDSGQSDDSTATKDPADSAAFGTLSLNLVGADTDGRQYRLRAAQFEITSYANQPFPQTDGGYDYFDTTVSTEDDIDAPKISLHVVPGYYDISLISPDWYLERRVDAAWQRVEQAVLLSSTYQSAYVYDGSVINVAFRFGVDGELIDFRAGDIDIGIEIEQPGEGAPDAGISFIGGIGGIGGIISGGGFIGGGSTADSGTSAP